MRRLKYLFLVLCIVFGMIVGMLVFWLPGRYTVPIIMYHQVTKTDDWKPNWVSPENFAWQMAYLKDHGFRVVPLDELVEATRAGRVMPRKTAVITFDDGYENNYTDAFPVLKRYGFPATIFVAADDANTQGYLTWGQMQEMMASGITIGSHTRTQAYLPDLSAEEQWQEIEGAKRILEQNLGVPVDLFAYPIGGFSDEIKGLVQKAGYKAACATNRGYDRFNRDVYELNRVRFSDKDVRWDYVWIKLSGYYNLFRKAKRPN